MRAVKCKFHHFGVALSLLVAASCLLWSCQGSETIGGPGASPIDPTDDQGAPAITNRLDIPPPVRRNLGITFVNVEKRSVQQTRRVPGYFELRPEAVRDYHASVEGRVELKVNQFQQVTKGDVLYQVESPEWRTMQLELSEALNAISNGEALIEVAHASIAESEQAAEVLQQRINNLSSAAQRSADLEAELLTAKKTILRLKAELHSTQTTLKGAEDHYTVMLNTAEVLTGVQYDTLLSVSAGNSANAGEGFPYWWTLQHLTRYALTDGVVDELAVTNGGWAEAGGLILRVVDPQMLRFHALAPQTDIVHFQQGQQTLIVPGQGASVDLQDNMTGKLHIGYRADPQQRTLPLYVTPEELSEWAAPGVSAFLEVVIAGNTQPQLAIPFSCVVRDGLSDIFFRRTPDNSDQVIRMDADLGVSDGRWVIIKSGVRVGDEIVMDGRHELLLASSTVGGGALEKGHFHSDGTFHLEDDK